MKRIERAIPFAILLWSLALVGAMAVSPAAGVRAEAGAARAAAGGCLRRSLLIGRLHPRDRGGNEESRPPVGPSHPPQARGAAAGGSGRTGGCAEPLALVVGTLDDIRPQVAEFINEISGRIVGFTGNRGNARAAAHRSASTP